MEFLGKLNDYLADDAIFEISIDSYHEVYLHSKEGWKRAHPFTSKEELLKITTGLKEFCSIKESVHSGYLNEFVSFSLVQAPLSLKGDSLRILKLSKSAYDLTQYRKWQAIDEESEKVLKDVLKSKKGILCAGDFGSGKTTLFNVLINSLPSEESLVVIESEPGLTIHRERVSRIMPRGRSDIHIPEAIDAASTMQGDTIALSWMGERWASPFMDFLKNNARGIAVVGGHSPENTLSRLLRQTVISSDGYNLEEAASVLHEVFQVIVYQEKRDDNKRVVTHIDEIVLKGGELSLKPLYQKK